MLRYLYISRIILLPHIQLNELWYFYAVRTGYKKIAAQRNGIDKMIRVLKFAINNLLNCPFCGHEAELLNDPPYDICIARCPKCDIRAYEHSKEAVTSKWNQRTEPKKEDEFNLLIGMNLSNQPDYTSFINNLMVLKLKYLE